MSKLDAKYEKFRPKKFLGQNFLVDDNIAKKIISFLDIKDGDNVVEIGPGHGALTKHLVNYKINYTAVELDKFIVEELTGKYGDKINLIHEDFLKTDISKIFPSPFKVIGNIPYNITTEILFKLYDNKQIVQSAVLMMQKEVAQRLTAKPNTKDYGILAILTQVNAVPKIVYNVPPTAFFPKPKVTSSVVRLELKNDSSVIKDVNLYNLFKEIVKSSFNQRRKVMRNSLKKLFEEKGIAFESVNFDFSKRPEQLSIQEFADLTNEVSTLL
jgi:16S rRNA (adenine1518-N6/adenine1519-N6)-dimethyltransferase